MGTTISTDADDDLTRAVEKIVSEEGLPRAQVATSALVLFAALPAGGRKAWEYLRHHAAQEELQAISLTIARELIGAQHDMTMRGALNEMSAEQRAAFADSQAQLAAGEEPLFTNSDAVQLARVSGLNDGPRSAEQRSRHASRTRTTREEKSMPEGDRPDGEDKRPADHAKDAFKPLDDELRIPNAESRTAMREIDTGEGLIRFDCADAFFKDLGI